MVEQRFSSGAEWLGLFGFVIFLMLYMYHSVLSFCFNNLLFLVKLFATSATSFSIQKNSIFHLNTNDMYNTYLSYVIYYKYLFILMFLL